MVKLNLCWYFLVPLHMTHTMDGVISYVISKFTCLDSLAIQENRVTTVQCLSGTGSLRVGGEFLARHYHQVSVDLLIHPLPNLSYPVNSNMCIYVQNLPVVLWFAAYYIYSTANVGKPPKSFYFSWVISKDFPLLWSSNSWTQFSRFGLFTRNNLKVSK